MTPLLPLALDLLLQSTGLLLLGLLALRLMRGRGAAVQTLIGRAALAGVGLILLIAPLTGHIRPLWRVTLPAAEPIAAGLPHPSPFVPVAASLSAAVPPRIGEPSLPPAALSPAPPERSAPPSRMRLLLPVLAAVWGTGTTLLLLWLGVCQGRLIRLTRYAHPITVGLAAETLAGLTPRPPALLTEASVQSPFLAGLRRPAIFLPPEGVAAFDQTNLRAIFVHELAHLARRDNAWTLAARLLCALLWPQPLLWVLCRRLEQIGEEACDQAVLAQNCPPRAYADCLLTLAEHHPLGRRERTLSAGVAPFRSSLGRRVQRILDKGTRTMSAVSPRLRLTVAILTLAAALGGVCLVSSAPAQVRQPAPARAASPTLVGIWAGKSSPKAAHSDTIIFGPHGDAAAVTEHGSKIEIGRYTLTGSTLAFTPTRTLDNGHIVPNGAEGHTYTSTYSIAGDILTLIHDTNASPVTARRVAAYPEGATLETVAMQQAATLRAAPVQPSSGQAQLLNQARFLAGLTPVQGPGVVVTLNDSRKGFPARLPAGMAPPNVIHDTDINQVVNELKAAGAEAIAVNGERLVATSAVRDAGPTIFINFSPTVPPYVIKAIGNPHTLASALTMPGGIASQLRNYDPAMFSVREAGTLNLPPYWGGSEPRYAKPIMGKPQGQAINGNSKAEHDGALAKAIHLGADWAALDAELTALRRKADVNLQQQAALGKLGPALAALQALDHQRALFQLEVLLDTQGKQTTQRRADSQKAQQTLRALTARRVQMAHALTPQERALQTRLHACDRQLFTIGNDTARVQVAKEEKGDQYAAVLTRLGLPTAQISGHLVRR